MSDLKQQLREAQALYRQEDYRSALSSFESLLSQQLSPEERQDCQLNIASCSASLGNYRAALEQYNSLSSDSEGVRYNRALCHYKLANFDEALDIVDELLSSGTVIEKYARNLKSATLFKLKLVNEAHKLLQLEQEEEESDPVLRHNAAIFSPEGIDAAIDSLKDIVEASSIGEAAQNLLKLYLLNGDYDLANELIQSLRDRGDDSDKLELYEILANHKKLGSDKMTCKKLDSLLDKLLARWNRELDSRGDFYLLIELATKQLAVLLWWKNQYSTLEKVLLKVEPILGETNFWPVWFAHSLYMQDTRYEECSYLYEKLLVEAHDLLLVDSIVLANLCVAYLLTGRNEAAESLIKQIELEESRRTPRVASMSYSCIVNLTIGQLYCVKMNYSFGLPRIFKTLEPLDANLNAETWFVCKRCILSLLDKHCKSMIYVIDELFDQINTFLVECERHGLQVRAAPVYEISADLEAKLSEHERATLLGRNSVSYEARYLRSLLLTVLHD